MRNTRHIDWSAIDADNWPAMDDDAVQNVLNNFGAPLHPSAMGMLLARLRAEMRGHRDARRDVCRLEKERTVRVPVAGLTIETDSGDTLRFVPEDDL